MSATVIYLADYRCRICSSRPLQVGDGWDCMCGDCADARDADNVCTECGVCLDAGGQSTGEGGLCGDCELRASYHTCRECDGPADVEDGLCSQCEIA